MNWPHDHDACSASAAAAGLWPRQVRRHFRPEFVNRVDEFIIFEPLRAEQMAHIVGLRLKGVVGRLAEKRIRMGQVNSSSSSGSGLASSSQSKNQGDQKGGGKAGGKAGGGSGASAAGPARMQGMGSRALKFDPLAKLSKAAASGDDLAADGAAAPADQDTLPTSVN
ncbi:uncharacterized protein HaLaN_11368 [Haematococcus lacustris]|uniref:Uncharacterized protein n=1 Tax=Haematococcus lacustris TaxID=44745 RepID=A0A699Z7D2_HAELA|nr:uncharacterized protein HaLaN_11368 [Haematococcus lacustris]